MCLQYLKGLYPKGPALAFLPMEREDSGLNKEGEDEKAQG